MSHKDQPYRNVTRDYKISLANKTKAVVKSRFPNQDPKLWQPQPQQVQVGRKSDGIWQYVSAKNVKLKLRGE
jgi:hypothetical protein